MRAASACDLSIGGSVRAASACALLIGGCMQAASACALLLGLHSPLYVSCRIPPTLRMTRFSASLIPFDPDSLAIGAGLVSHGQVLEREKEVLESCDTVAVSGEVLIAIIASNLLHFIIDLALLKKDVLQSSCKRCYM